MKSGPRKGLLDWKVVVGLAPSFWLLAFSMCIFTSLALVKRCSASRLVAFANQASKPASIRTG